MYRHVCTITYLYTHVYTWYIHVYNSMYRYKHVYTWYRPVYTTLPNPVHMVRIPDVPELKMSSNLKCSCVQISSKRQTFAVLVHCSLSWY